MGLSHFASFGLLCFATPLKCGEIYDINFVTDFMENKRVKNCENRSTFVKLMDECIVAQLSCD